MSTVYRLEHRASRLGPFEHRGQLSSIIHKGIIASSCVMEDIDAVPEVARHLSDPRLRFGFSTQKALDGMIRDRNFLARRGFIEVKLDVDVVYQNPRDDQVVFLDQRAPFSPSRIEAFRGAAARQACKTALDHRVYSPRRLLQYFFGQMVSNYNPKTMGRWVCSLAYDQEIPIGVLFGHDDCIGVYVKPDYRRLGVGSSLVNHNRTLVVSVKSCADDRQGRKFFKSLGVEEVSDRGNLFF